MLKSFRKARKIQHLGISMRSHVVFAMLFVSLLPLLVLTENRNRAALSREIDVVEQGHLIIAKNLASTLDRYIVDAKATFAYFVNRQMQDQAPTEIESLMRNYNLHSLLWFPTDSIKPEKLLGSAKEVPPRKFFSQVANGLREGEIGLSGVQALDGQPTIYLIQRGKDGEIYVGAMDTGFVVSQQESIAFGQRGHAMIVDQFGRVLAHPKADWTQNSVDASKLEIVQNMIGRNTGVMQFYSPPLDADMIAGYTYVPSTGWGVMVPQPMSELMDAAQLAANRWLSVLVFMAIFSLVSAWLLSGIIVGPLKKIGQTFASAGKGRIDNRIDGLGRFVPRELNELKIVINSTLAKLNQAEKLQTSALNAAREANNHKSQAISILSHEMRTPLNGLIGAINLLGQTSLNEKQAGYLEIAETSSTTLLRHVNSVLEAAKLENRPRDVKKKRVNLHDMVKSICAENSSIIEAKRLNLKLDYSRELKNIVETDRDLMRSIISNLVSNAVKFTKTGTISVTLEPQSEERLKLCVKDTGSGIPTSELEHIFEPFVVLNNRYHQSNVGTGLGLSIVKKSVDALEGEISVVSKIGVGTTFNVQIPFLSNIKEIHRKVAKKDQQETNVVLTDSEEFTKRSNENCELNILVVDDVEINRIVLTQQLSSLGVNVKTAKDGLEAVSLSQTEIYDAIFMDIRMPRLNGIEATKRIRKSNGPNMSTIIIAQTATAGDEDIKNFISCGIDRVLQKPIFIDSLLNLIEEIKSLSNESTLSVDVQKCLVSNQILNTVKNSIGEEHTYTKYLEIIERASEIVTFLEKSDEDELVSEECQVAVHDISGECAAIGVLALNSNFRRVETILKSGKIMNLSVVLKELKASLIDTRDEVDRAFIH